MTENQLAAIAFNCGLKVHRKLGPGLLESAYETCLNYELSKHDIEVRRQVRVPIEYDGVHLESGFRADLIINDKLLLEFKSVSTLHPIHTAQTLTYLKLTGIKLGLLINFNEHLFKDGIKRVINGKI